MPAMRTHDYDCSFVPHSAYDLLPAELLLPAISLCATNASLPAVCRALSPAAAFRPGQQPHRIWLHRAIFIEPRVDPFTKDVLNCRYPPARQLESHVACFFKSLAPTGDAEEAAAGMAPDGPLTNPILITKAFVEWIFGVTGPFGPRSDVVSAKRDVVAELQSIRAYRQPDGASWAQDHEQPNPKLPKYPLLTWRLVPDVFLLVNLLIRTSQLDLLEFALTRLLALFPSFRGDTLVAPFSIWSHNMLDNRTRLRLDCAFMTGLNGDPSMSYPTFLCMLALWDWSLPAIAIIERIFTPEHVSLTDVARQAISEFSIFRGMLSTLTHIDPTAPSMSTRVLSVLDWLHSTGANIDFNLTPLISIYIQNNYPTFADVFLKYDVPRLANLDIGPGNHHFDYLGDMIADWATLGHTSVLQVALEKELLPGPVKRRLLIKAAQHPGKKWAAEVVGRLAKNGGEKLRGELAAKVLRVLRR